MLYVKALHVIFMVAWFAGLFYLPRLFVYHAAATDAVSSARFKVMERKLYYVISTPAAILTTLFGLWLLFAYAWEAYHTMKWLHLKLTLALVLLAYHVHCGLLVRDFARDQNRRSHRWFRFYNEIPTLLLFAIVILVIVRPF